MGAHESKNQVRKVVYLFSQLDTLLQSQRPPSPRHRCRSHPPLPSPPRRCPPPPPPGLFLQLDTLPQSQRPPLGSHISPFPHSFLRISAVLISER